MAIDFDFPELREPVEVYLAAIGQPAALAARLRSPVPLSAWDREALALLVLGELVPAPPKVGRPPVHHRPFHLIPYGTHPMGHARQHYEMTAARLRRRKRLHGKAEWLKTAVARKWSLDEEAFRRFLNRPRSSFPAPELALGEPARFRAWHRARLAISSETPPDSA